MKSVFTAVLLIFLSQFSLEAEPATKEDIKIILQQMDKRFEQVDKRFEQMEKRFEQVDRRFDQLMWMIGLWIPVAFGIVFYILRRLHAQEDRVFDLASRETQANENPTVLIHMLENADQNQRKKIRELIKG